MSETPTPKYDLEERTYEFAKCVRQFVKGLARTICNIEDVKQLVRASGSVDANYVEANEAISKKDFLFRIRLCRKESKESRYSLRLVDTGTDAEIIAQRERLIAESTELLKKFNAIAHKSQ